MKLNKKQCVGTDGHFNTEVFSQILKVPHLEKKLRTNTYNPNPTKFYHSQQIQLPQFELYCYGDIMALRQSMVIT